MGGAAAKAVLSGSPRPEMSRLDRQILIVAVAENLPRHLPGRIRDSLQLSFLRENIHSTAGGPDPLKTRNSYVYMKTVAAPDDTSRLFGSIPRSALGGGPGMLPMYESPFIGIDVSYSL